MRDLNFPYAEEEMGDCGDKVRDHVKSRYEKARDDLLEDQEEEGEGSHGELVLRDWRGVAGVLKYVNVQSILLKIWYKASNLLQR